MVPVINDLFRVILLLTFQLKHTEVIDDYQIGSFNFYEELEFMPFNVGQFKLIQLVWIPIKTIYRQPSY